MNIQASDNTDYGIFDLGKFRGNVTKIADSTIINQHTVAYAPRNDSRACIIRKQFHI